jgi:hypothetical protein
MDQYFKNLSLVKWWETPLKRTETMIATMHALDLYF